jgi:crotonobetainyl-CoA:carnitine CoA-transferase CaiB-like acyl-CoA transferase
MTQKFWVSLVQAMDRTDLLSDPRFPDPNTRAKNRAQLTEALDPVFRTRATAAWLEKFNGVLPAAPVHRLDQALDSDFAKATGMVSSVSHPAKGDLRVLANPLRIDGERPSQAACAPLGADNALVDKQA